MGAFKRSFTTKARNGVNLVPVPERINFYLGDCALIQVKQSVFGYDCLLRDLDNAYYNFKKIK